MLNGRFLGVAFDFGREGISAPPLQPHICQGNGKAFSVLMRGAANQAPLRFPMRGFRPLGSVLERHFSPFSKAVEL
ncbi:glgB, partial [Symbiodinium necroappetens]